MTCSQGHKSSCINKNTKNVNYLIVDSHASGLVMYGTGKDIERGKMGFNDIECWGAL